MSDNYNWKVLTMDREIREGTVERVYWELSAEREPDYVATIQSFCNFTANPLSPGFIPYEDLQEETCIGWVKDQVGAEKVLDYESQITENLNEQQQPTHESGVPWETSVVTLE